MEPSLFDELKNILRMPRSQALVKLRDKKRKGELTSEGVQTLIKEFLNPTRIDACGRTVGLHTQLARTRFADCSIPDREARGTPPQRQFWSLVDRKNEPIRRGSPMWEAAAGKRHAIKDKHDCNTNAKSPPVKCTDLPIAEAAPVQGSAPVEAFESFFEQALPVQDYAPVENIDPFSEEAFPDNSLAPMETFQTFDRQTSTSPDPIPGEESAHIMENAPLADASDPSVQYLQEEDEDEDDDEDDEDNDAYISERATRWGRVERGRDHRQRLAARLRCASGQPSSLRSSWSFP